MTPRLTLFSYGEHKEKRAVRSLVRAATTPMMEQYSTIGGATYRNSHGRSPCSGHHRERRAYVSCELANPWRLAEHHPKMHLP